MNRTAPSVFAIKRDKSFFANPFVDSEHSYCWAVDSFGAEMGGLLLVGGMCGYLSTDCEAELIDPVSYLPGKSHEMGHFRLVLETRLCKVAQLATKLHIRTI